MQAKIKANVIFISRLSDLMKQKAFNQSSLASVAKISQTSISAYLRGKRNPGAEELGALAQALNVSMDWLWGSVEDPENTMTDSKPKETKKSDWKSRAKVAEAKVEALKEIIPAILDSNAKMNEAAKRLSKLNL